MTGTPLDIFNHPSFSVRNTTDAINVVPNRYGRLGELNLFPARGIRTTYVQIEYKNGVLNLIPGPAPWRARHQGHERQAEPQDVRDLPHPLRGRGPGRRRAECALLRLRQSAHGRAGPGQRQAPGMRQQALHHARASPDRRAQGRDPRCGWIEPAEPLYRVPASRSMSRASSSRTGRTSPRVAATSAGISRRTSTAR